MRRHAKAPSAGSTLGNGSSRGLFGRALATRGPSGNASGSGAPSHRRAFLVLGLVAVFAIALAPHAQASKVKIASIGLQPPNGELGHFSSANSPRGIAVNNATGNVYVADFNNKRIDEFTSGGAPIRAWGNQVVESGQDFAAPASAVQTLTVTATGGKYRLKFSGQETGDLLFSAGAAEIQTALRGLSSVGPVGNVNVTVTGSGPYTITFAATLANSPEPAITAEPSVAEPLTGGTASVAVTNPGATGFTVCNATSNPQDVCREGTGSVAAGGMTGPTGVAIDQSTGNVYVTEQNNLRVDEYSEAGTWIATWGLNVVKFGQDDTGTGFEICKAASNPVDICQVGTAGGTAGAFFSPFQSGIAVNPVSHNVLVADQVNNRVQEFSSAGAFLRTFGADVVTDGATGTGTLTSGSNKIEGVVTTSKAFRVGQTITSGADIPPGTTITAVSGTVGNPGTITLSQTATGSGTLKPLTVAPGAENVPSNEKQTVDIGSRTGGTFTLTFKTPNPSNTTATATAIPFNATALELEAKLAALSNIGAGNVAVSGPDGGPWVVEFMGTRFADTDVMEMTGSATGLTPAGGAITVTSANGFETCTIAADCQAGAGGNAVGQFGSATGASRLAVDGSGNVYVVDFLNQRVQRFDPGGGGSLTASLFGPSGPAATPFAVAIDPTNNNVLIGRTASGGTSEMQVAEYDSSGTLLDTHGAGSKIGEGVSGAVSTTSGNLGYYPSNGNIYLDFISSTPKVFILNNAPAPMVHFQEITGITASSATFKGTVTPPAEFEGNQFPVSWHFEYSNDGIHWTKTPNKTTDATPIAHLVEATATGLLPNTTYQVRLCATTGGAEVCDPSPPKQFTTLTEAPTIVSTWAEGATETEATLAAEVNPNNLPSTYHFEWTTDQHWQEAHTYDHRIPAFERKMGSGTDPTVAKDEISGLQPASVYHFRIVTQNAAGPAAIGPDQELETLNSCGLPDNRCPELVSPPDKGTQGHFGALFGAGSFQPGLDGESVAYPFQSPPDSSAGGDTIYVARRSVSGWQSRQISPPSLVTDPIPGLAGGAAPGYVSYDSPDLSCSVVQSVSPLTADTPALDQELGLANLYRRDNTTGAYRLITNVVPVNVNSGALTGERAGTGALIVAGSSPDCNRVYFRSEANLQQYLSQGSGLYEWNDGVIEDAGRLPDGSLPSVVSLPNGVNGTGVGFGSEVVAGSRRNAVSPDGSRMIFGALSDAAATAGKPAVFLREGGSTIEVSRRQGGAHDSLGSRYEMASGDGTHIFFLASYGLTPSSSNGPQANCSVIATGEAPSCDLYDYNTETTQLTDLSADSNSADGNGAVVKGVIDASSDGSRVYFAALGQLIEEKGKTYLQNASGSKSANVYLWSSGQLRYVTNLAFADLDLVRDQTAVNGSSPQAQATPDGEHLLFRAGTNIAGYESGGFFEAYLYSAGPETLECVSCRRDGLDASGDATLINGNFETVTSQAQRQEMSDDGSRVFFRSPDALAVGAVAGDRNLYEWRPGQVFLLATGPNLGLGSARTSIQGVATPTARDLFINTAQKLDSHDVDDASDLYDLRAGGGFAPPAPAPSTCDPSAGACQGSGSPAPPDLRPGSSAFSGPGNGPRVSPQHRKHRRKRHRNRHKKKTHPKNKTHQRTGSSSRGGVK